MLPLIGSSLARGSGAVKGRLGVHMRGGPMTDRPSPTERAQPANAVGDGGDAQWVGLDPAAARVAWTLLVIGGAMAFVYVLRQVLLLLAFSVFFAYLIFPLVEATQRFMPGLRSRTRAIVFVYLVLLGL